MSEMTKTIREKEPTSSPLHRLYALFRLHFIPEQNKHHSRADFSNIKRENGESTGHRHIFQNVQQKRRSVTFAKNWGTSQESAVRKELITFTKKWQQAQKKTTGHQTDYI